jgi:hypothetical protein
LKGSFERPAAERPARSVAPLEIGEPPRKILRPLDAARRFTPAGFAFLQSRHHIMQAAFLRLPTSAPVTADVPARGCLVGPGSQ